VLKLGTLQKVDQIYLETSEMWFWRRMEIILTDRVRMKKYYISQKGQKVTGLVKCCVRNCLPQHIPEGKIREV
jgi:hypothetical protein